jgi:hypothetical protein
MTAIPESDFDALRSTCGHQLQLLPRPPRQRLPRAEWRTLEALGVERRHQRYSRSSRDEAKRFYRAVFVRRDSGDAPPIA